MISKHTGKGPQDRGCGELYKVDEMARELNNITEKLKFPIQTPLHLEFDFE